MLNTDLTDPNERVTIDRHSLEQLVVSETSPMPAGLFNRMTKDEILDLIAYLISGGESGHELFEAERRNSSKFRPFQRKPRRLPLRTKNGPRLSMVAP